MPTKRKHWNHCVGCGKLLQRRYQSQTCRSPECRALLLLHPQIREEGRTGTPLGRGRWKPRPHRETISFLARRWNVPLTEEQVRDFGEITLSNSSVWEGEDWGMMDDDRGDALPAAQGAVWGWLSRRKVFLKSVGQKEGEAALIVRIHRRGMTHSILKRALGPALTLAKGCELFYAWRCPCDFDHRVEFETIETLPSEEGYHNPCPKCGAAPLEVIYERRDKRTEEAPEKA